MRHCVQITAYSTANWHRMTIPFTLFIQSEIFHNLAKIFIERLLKHATRGMSIAFQKHTEITARHMNPYVGYEGSIKGDDVFQCPVLLERKQSCDAFEETCNGFAKIDENTQASDDIQSEENVALFIPQRNSVISSASPTKIAAVSESRNQSPSGSSSDEMHSARMKDSELISLDTHPVESDHKTKSTNNVTAGLYRPTAISN